LRIIIIILESIVTFLIDIIYYNFVFKLRKNLWQIQLFKE